MRKAIDENDPRRQVKVPKGCQLAAPVIAMKGVSEQREGKPPGGLPGGIVTGVPCLKAGQGIQEQRSGKEKLPKKIIKDIPVMNGQGLNAQRRG